MDKNIQNLIEYPKTGILSKVILSIENMEVTLFSMAAKTDMSEHTSTKNGLVYIVEGEGIFSLEGKNIAMKTGVIIHMPKNAVHSLKAKSNTSFLLVLTK